MASKNPTLQAEKRTVLGKEVKKLRRTGKLPANVYGKNLESTAIQVDTKAFEALYKEVGETGLIDLQVDGESRPVLVKNLQMKYPLRIPLHVDFYQVNLKEKVKAMIPIEIVGEPKAVTEKIGTMIQTLNEIEVEALPTDLPENVEVNVENLANIDENITVGDLSLPSTVEVLTEKEQTIVKIAELVEEEPEPEPEAEGEGAEGEAGEEGDLPAGEAGKKEGEKAEKDGEKAGNEGKEEKPEEKEKKEE